MQGSINTTNFFENEGTIGGRLALPNGVIPKGTEFLLQCAENAIDAKVRDRCQDALELVSLVGE